LIVTQAARTRQKVAIPAVIQRVMGVILASPAERLLNGF
jgi:hypothetical protein